MIRWIKCVFKDCDQEDAVKDHEVAEREREENKKQQTYIQDEDRKKRDDQQRKEAEGSKSQE